MCSISTIVFYQNYNPAKKVESVGILTASEKTSTAVLPVYLSPGGLEIHCQKLIFVSWSSVQVICVSAHLSNTAAGPHSISGAAFWSEGLQSLLHFRR